MKIPVAIKVLRENTSPKANKEILDVSARGGGGGGHGGVGVVRGAVGRLTAPPAAPRKPT